MTVAFKTTNIEAVLGDASYPATLVEIEIEGGVMEPSELAGLTLPDVDGSKGVIISGRSPQWCVAHLTHHYHVTKWVATFDPRFPGAVVVSTHARNVPPIGSVVTVPKSE